MNILKLEAFVNAFYLQSTAGDFSADYESYYDKKIKEITNFISNKDYKKHLERAKRLIELYNLIKANKSVEAEVVNKSPENKENLLEELKEERILLQNEVNRILNTMRVDLRRYEQSLLRDDSSKSSDEKGKAIKLETIELKKLIADRYHQNKFREIRARKALIKALEENKPESDIKLLLNEVNEGIKEKISMYGNEVARAEEKRELIQSGTLKGLIKDLSTKIATSKSTINQLIIGKTAKSAKSGNNKEDLLNHPLVINFNKNASKVDEFKNVLRTVEQSNMIEGKLDNSKINFINTLIQKAKDIINDISNERSFGAVIKSLNKIVEFLADKIKTI